MSTIEINLLGAPGFVRDGLPTPITRAKGVALLAYLAVTRAAQPRAHVLDMLWPESMPQAARKNMRNTLWALREALGEAIVEQRGAWLSLSAAVAVDVHALEDGLLLLESAAVEQLEAAAARYHGPLADGLVVERAPEFEIWLATERERLAIAYVNLLERIVALRSAAGDWQAVADYAQRMLNVEPLREAAYLSAIEAAIRLGQRDYAAHVYATLRDVLRRELGVDPLPETTARYEALLAGAVGAIRTTQPRRPLQLAQPVPLVGRRAELAALDEELALAAEGQARVVLLSGELGIGKTRLWQAWSERLPEGVTLLATHALELSEPVPFGPVLQLFRQPGPAGALITPPSPLAPIWLAELARLLPEIGARWPGLPAPLSLAPAEERGRLLQALTEAARLLAQRVLALVVDDLQWADPSTLDWLRYLVDQLHDQRLLLVGAYRPGEATPHLVAAITAWQRQGRVRQLELARLDEREARELLAALGTPERSESEIAGWLRQSGGNPYFLSELRRAGAGQLPGDLASLLRARIRAGLPAAAQQVLQAAAVLGESFDAALLRATAGRSEEETLDAIEALLDADILAIDGGAYRFVHPLVAAVVQNDLAPERRTFLHRRAALAIEQSSAGRPARAVERLAEHLAAAGDLERAGACAELAGAHALQVGAFIEAAEWARRALEWHSTPRSQLLLGQALAMSGDIDRARSQLESALAAFMGVGDAAGATAACIQMALIEIGRHQPRAARAWLDHAPVAAAQARDPALGAQAHLLAAGAARQSRAYQQAAAELEQAEQIAEREGLADLAPQIAFERGNLLADSGHLSAALQAFDTALLQAEQTGNVLYQAMAANNLAYHRMLAGDIPAAQQLIDRAQALVGRHALSFLAQYTHSTQGEIAMARGDDTAAASALAQALDAAQTWRNSVQIANVRINRAALALHLGDLAAAREALGQAAQQLGDAEHASVRAKLARTQAALDARLLSGA
jgi:predicted ATPase/DNA-binding SARP family transcriptional activator